VSREEDIFHADVQRTFATDYGQRVLRDLVLTYTRRVFDDDSPYRTAYNVGKADLVMHLVSLTEEEFTDAT